MSFQPSTSCKLLTGLTAAAFPVMAFAYVGPGAGITAIGSVLALLVGIALAIVGFVWYPLKRYFRSRSGKPGAENAADKTAGASTDDPKNH